MRFLLDTNIIIPLEDSNHVLEERLATFVRLAQENNHQLVYHPASEDDFRRDKNAERCKRNLDRLKQYIRLDRLECPWNTQNTLPNDAADNEILYALKCDAVHALVTEDQGIHGKAKTFGLVGRVYTIQTVEDLLLRLHHKTLVQLPNIEDVPLYSLTQYLEHKFFDSLRLGYPEFNEWFKNKARNGEKAWVAWEDPGVLGAICIYVRQDNETITDGNLKLNGPALKLSTFKVGPSVRGRKIGELFLKAAFRFASHNCMENIFIHGDVDQHHFLFVMLEDFGFTRVGSHPGSNSRDAVYLKRHPATPPNDDKEPFEYMMRYFPHFRQGPSVAKYIVPIRPEYHRILFSDYNSPVDCQLQLFNSSSFVGNAIKLAYLCHAKINKINKGDIVFFYRSRDERAITSIGVVEDYVFSDDASVIAARVKRRTVYDMSEINEMAKKKTKVMLFRLIKHLEQPIDQAWLEAQNILNGPPQSITGITHDAFERALKYGW